MSLRVLPRGFRRGHDDSIACPHRNASCCDACVAAHEELVDVLSVVYWVPCPVERAELLAEIEITKAARAVRWCPAASQVACPEHSCLEME